MKDLWGSPEGLKKGKKAKTKGKVKSSGMGSQSLSDMKSGTLTNNGGWGKGGVKAQSGFKVGGKGKTSDKTFKSLGF